MNLIAQSMLENKVNDYSSYTPRMFYADVKIVRALFTNLTDFSYRPGKISKGNGKVRLLTIPNDKLKNIQSTIYSVLNAVYMNIVSSEYYSDIKDIANGFVANKSTITNANKHLDNYKAIDKEGGDVVLYKADIDKFFDNIQFKVFEANMYTIVSNIRLNENYNNLFCYKEMYLCNAALNDLMPIIYRTCFRNKILPQGSPASPLISNITMLEFDKKISKVFNKSFSYKMKLVYSRYADDLCITLRNDDKELIREISECLTLNIKRQLRPFKLKLNQLKTEIRNNGNRLNITGICINRCNKLYPYVLEKVAIDSDNCVSLTLFDWQINKDIDVFSNNRFSGNTPYIKRAYLKARLDRIIHDFTDNRKVDFQHFSRTMGYWAYINYINPINFFKYRKEIDRFLRIIDRIPHRFTKKLHSNIIKPYDLHKKKTIGKLNSHFLCDNKLKLSVNFTLDQTIIDKIESLTPLINDLSVNLDARNTFRTATKAVLQDIAYTNGF